jgi:serine/threonine-protein kinase
MATVHLGRLLGPVGFSRTVAIKRLHAQFASDPEFVSMFLDEARLAARIRHPNVVPTLDVVATGGELFLVMEYVPGESIARLSRVLREHHQSLPPRILSAVMAGVLHGLHAAHEAKDERGHPLGIVHRDMSPQNVLVGTDGVARVLDFGVAKAAGRMQTTREGQIKGKLAYMPPEQLRGATVNRQSDIYAAGVMLWELVTGQRLFGGDNEGAIVAKILDGRVEVPSKVLMQSVNQHQTLNDQLLRGVIGLDPIILRALAMNPPDRYATAREMAIEIERTIPPATGSEVADWVEHIAKDVLHSRAAMVAEIESSASIAATAIEPREGHVQSVLQAKSTLAPNQGGLHAHSPAPDPAASVQTMTRLDQPQMPQPMATSPTPFGRAPYPVEGPPVTQPSSISVASGMGSLPNDPRGGQRTALAAIGGALLGLLILAGGIAYKMSLKHEAPVLGAPGTPSALATDPAPSVSTAASTPPTIDNQGGPAAALDAGAGAAANNAGGTGGTSAGKQPGNKPRPLTGTATPPPTTKPTSAPTAQVVTPPPTAAPDCSPPFWYDGQNVKRYKPQCLDK